MPKTQIDEFSCSDGSSGIILPDGQMEDVISKWIKFRQTRIETMPE